MMNEIAMHLNAGLRIWIQNRGYLTIRTRIFFFFEGNAHGKTKLYLPNFRFLKLIYSWIPDSKNWDQIRDFQMFGLDPYPLKRKAGTVLDNPLRSCEYI